MIDQILLLFISLSTLTSITIAVIVTEFKNPIVPIIFAFKGAFTGIIIGTFWIYFTDGLAITLYTMAIPVILSSFSSYVLLHKVDFTISHSSFDRQLRRWPIVIIFALAVLVAFMSMPFVYSSTFNAQRLPSDVEIQLDWDAGEYTVRDGTEIKQQMHIGNIEGMALPSKSFSNMPTPGSYFNFKAVVEKGAEWHQPYLKIGVYRDVDGSGTVSEGDILWSDIHYKISTDDSLWRANFLWDGVNPKAAAHSSGGMLLPIFHANKIEQRFDETDVVFRNTPEGFQPSKDMISWSYTEGVITLEEQVIDFASIAKDEYAEIKGTLFCSPDYMGNNIIVIRAYDLADTTLFDVYDDTDIPFTELILPFEITQEPEEATVAGIPHFGAIVLLGLVTIVAIYISKKEHLI